MRTTLKRGIGRGAAVNGNGRPVLPPGALSPITIYRQPEPARRGGWAVVGAVVAWMFVALLMTAGAIGGGYYLFLEQRVEDLVATTPDVVIAQKQLDIPLANEPATALVIGYDKRKGEDASEQSRSDTSCSCAPIRTPSRSRCSRSRATSSSTSRAPASPPTAAGSTRRTPSAARRGRCRRSAR